MNRHLHSPTILTEFARTFEEEQETIFSKLVNKLTNTRPTNESPIHTSVLHEERVQGENLVANATARPTATVSNQPSPSANRGPAITVTKSPINSNAGPSASSKEPSPAERNTTSVLRRLSSLISQKSTTTRSYKHTDLPKFWMPDSTSIECYDCSVKFSTFRRKHHCRLCGQIFCTKCCNQVVTGKIINCSDDLRVCNYCSKVVLTYLKTSSIAADLKPDLKALQDDLAQKLSTLQPPGNGGDANVPSGAGRSRRKISVGYQEERFAASAGSGISSADRKSILQQSNSLKTLYDEMCRSLPLYNRGHELIDFLFSKQKSSNNMQAVAILNAMIDAGFLIAISELRGDSGAVEEVENTQQGHQQEQSREMHRGSSGGSAEDEEDPVAMTIEFSEDTVYKLAVLQDRPVGAPGSSGTGGAYHLELNFKSSSVLMRSGNDDQSSLDSEDGVGGNGGGSTTLSSINLKDSVMDSSYLISTGAKALLQVFCEHEEMLVNQLLRAQNLDPSWSKTLIPIVARVANTLRLDAAYGTDAMDIRNYVYFKKVPGGERCESQILGGVVFSKNVAHKEMPQKVDKPRILLLQCAIAYQRVEGKFVSFDTLMLQERDYLRNKVSKIISLGPNIVLVHKNVAGIAQDMLRNNGITLVLDVKLCVLERIARFLDCDIISCIDSNVGHPKLGVCDRFRIQTFYDDQGSSKTLMCLEKQHSPRGCCVLLRGAKRSELSKIKKIASLLLLARHNWRFELSYLCDVYAMPPTPRASIFDSKESTPLEPPPLPSSALTAISGGEIKGYEERQPASTNSKPVSIDTTTTKVIRTTPGNTTNREDVGEWTDPLRAGESDGRVDEDDNSIELAVEMPSDNRFRSALSSTILSISPFVGFPLPYLETDSGRKCALRCYFPDELYFSKQWSDAGGGSGAGSDRYGATLSGDGNVGPSGAENEEDEKQLLPVHPFVTHKITASIDSKEMQTILASFRACGGRYPKVSMMKKGSSRKRRLTTLAQRSLEEFVYRDALDIENHQRLPVLFCSFNYNENVPSTFCAQPSYLDMQFYGQNDIMLGLFLEHYCFRSSYICKSCNLPMMDHVRRYVHSGGCIQVKLAEDLTKVDTGTILISSKCTICNEYSKPVPMSHDTWCYSFAKFLELRFHGHAYKKRSCEGVTEDIDGPSGAGDGAMVCRHSLHRDFEQNFSYKGIVASFRYTAIDVWEIVLPAISISLLGPTPNDVAHARTSITEQRTEEMKHLAVMGYDVYVKILEKLAELSADTDTFAKLKKKANQDQVAFKQRIEKVQKLLTEEVISVELVDDAIVTLKHVLAEAIEEWEPKLHEIINQAKGAQAPKSAPPGDGGNGTAGGLQVDNGTIATEELDLTQSGGVETQQMEQEGAPPVQENQPDSDQNESEPPKQELTAVGNDPPFDQEDRAMVPAVGSDEKQPTRDSMSEKKTVKTLLSQLLYTNDYSQILSSPLPPHEHHCLKAGLFPIVVNEMDVGSCIAYSLMSQEYRKMLDSMNSGGSGGVSTIGAVEASPSLKRKSQSVSSTTDGDETTGTTHAKSEQDKKHKNAAHSEIHFQDSNCNFVCKIYFAKEFDLIRCQVLKRPQTPGSTHRMSSASGTSMAPPSSVGGNTLVAGNGSSTSGTNASGPNAAGVTNADPLETSQEMMDMVRKMFARSLSKSVRWEARGGKSGSKFSKTVDDRFVLKEMSRTDLTIFENFAPNYFEYLQRCIKQKHITLLAKIFGVFKITIKRKDNTSVESSVLVMENLFCGKEISEKYDLKGSDRNRLVDPNRQTGTERVLMDENFIQMSWTNPLYILSHSKTVLKEAITRDACFLERNEVMDYSLLVGLENSEKNLVIGIIDYIRTYTLDKKFESMIKQSGLMGGHGKLPTVVSPKMYKNRFIVAMERYFLSVPDRWEGLAKK
ncbi:putative 1-phosphatidylinositol 3-phosphate 5-kinase [Anopheles ziemanni]|uniref:putative 1-phosphatidylinositol 3-phosphate 5-kinase n=1 Tax=Anopheles coustani TaxID=139045 RepID=UPI00265A3D5C|nr:putative 1-phosphatidylinositol 3-phosphate 5-kinase [Anopheles coustani]XP_058167335.1 putative 1-phosphatidylinositol 3-phosphate 5-kinase [Anopheles ziemanni]